MDDPEDFPRLIDARSETAPDKAAFRDAFRDRRCLIPADGFYEWLQVDGGKRPCFVHRRDGRPFTFAGLWDHWQGEGRKIGSCTILTCGPNEVMADIHDRMPVVLAEERYDAWAAAGDVGRRPQGGAVGGVSGPKGGVRGVSGPEADEQPQL